MDGWGNSLYDLPVKFPPFLLLSWLRPCIKNKMCMLLTCMSNDVIPLDMWVIHRHLMQDRPGVKGAL